MERVDGGGGGLSDSIGGSQSGASQRYSNADWMELSLGAVSGAGPFPLRLRLSNPGPAPVRLAVTRSDHAVQMCRGGTSEALDPPGAPHPSPRNKSSLDLEGWVEVPRLSHCLLLPAGFDDARDDSFAATAASDPAAGHSAVNSGSAEDAEARTMINILPANHQVCLTLSLVFI
jgi:hypothetical protein